MKILSVSYMDLSRSNLIVNYIDENGNEQTYTFNSLETDPDFSELINTVLDGIKNKSIIPSEPANPGFIEAYIIRTHRDALLKETDKYFTISDMPTKNNNYIDKLREYRQALRDIPQQDGFPDNVIWPEKPSI